MSGWEGGRDFRYSRRSSWYFGGRCTGFMAKDYTSIGKELNITWHFGYFFSYFNIF